MKHFIRVLFSLLMALAAVAGSSNASSYTIDTTSSPSVLTGLWWNASEAGWGLTITQQFGVIFVAMYTYDAANNPIWYVITNCPVAAGGCAGDIYKVNGGSPLAAIWRPSLALTKVGSGTLAFLDVNNATMTFTIDGVSGVKAITRQVFATAPVVQQPGGFPFTFTGSLPVNPANPANPVLTVQLNSITFQSSAATGICSATLLFTNTTSVAVTPFLRFDVVIGGVTTGQLIFNSNSLAPGAMASSTRDVSSNSSIVACGSFTLQFNAAGSSIFSP